MNMTDSIKIKGLCKSFGGKGLEDVSIDIPKGSIIGVVGENGAGKTTMLKCISGAFIPDSGTVRFPFERRCGDIGFVFDECHLPSFLTPSQISKVMSELVPSWDGGQFDSMMASEGIENDKKIRKMSRGMRMKIQTAVALSQKPSLLLMDEPTAGLDPAARDDFLDKVREFMQDDEHTTIISSHITDDLEKIADYIAFIHKGRLLMFEEKDILLERYGILRCGNLEDLHKIGDGTIVSIRRSEFGCSALVDDKNGLREAYPEAIVDDASLDDVFVFTIKGEAA